MLPEVLPKGERERWTPLFEKAMYNVFGYSGIRWMADSREFIKSTPDYDVWRMTFESGSYKDEFVCCHCGRQLSSPVYIRKHLAKEHSVTCEPVAPQ